MKIPLSFKQAYDDLRLALTEPTPWEEVASNNLANICREHHWLFDYRWKTLESAYSKLETGKYENLQQLKDFFAAIIVVPTLSEIQSALDEVSKVFSIQVKAREYGSAREFAYNDTHVIARLGDQAPANWPENLKAWDFEVQFHTGLQYAWWRATHDTLYKGGHRDWGTERVASQAKGSLELLDAVLSDLAGTAKQQIARELVPAIPDSTTKVVAMLKLWRLEFQPDDIVRFSQTAEKLILDSGIPIAEIMDLLEDVNNVHFVGQPYISPVQAIIIAISQLGGSDALKAVTKTGRRLLLSEEAFEAEPSLRQLPRENLVNMGD